MKKIGIVAAVCLLAVGIYIAFEINRDLHSMNIDTDNTIRPDVSDSSSSGQTDQDTALVGEDNNNKEKDDASRDFYAMVIGVDLREGQHMLNTDSIIVAHFLPEQPAVKLVSLPRDTRVQHQERYVKINSVFGAGYSHALREARQHPEQLSGKQVKIGSLTVPEEYISSGMAELRGVVESYLEIDIDYLFLVNFDTVVQLVDAVGGIEVNVDRSMRYEAEFDGTRIHLDEGLQTLTGQEALGFARFRLDSRGEAYDSNDFERGERQQQVIAALADRLTSWNSVRKAVGLIDIVSKNVKTDMDRSTMVSLLRQYYGQIDGERVITLPFEGYWDSPYVLISDENLRSLKREFHSTAIDSNSARVELPDQAPEPSI